MEPGWRGAQWHSGVNRSSADSDPDVKVWCGDPAFPTSEQGIRILGTPLGHPDFVRAELSQLSVQHDALMDKITHVQDLQCAWLLLLYCSAARANYYLCVVHPDLSSAFAAHHDASLRRVLSSLLGVDPSFLFWNAASLPLFFGGLGLRSASLLSKLDSLQMVQQWHPAVSTRCCGRHPLHLFPNVSAGSV